MTEILQGLIANSLDTNNFERLLNEIVFMINCHC